MTRGLPAPGKKNFPQVIIFVEEGLDTSKPIHKVVVTILSAIAEMERENIKDQFASGKKEAASRGRWQGGFAPLGSLSMTTGSWS